jgi:uncharacterized membrane protein|tara:strand:- start:5382 stop:5831 length:450 start_codon:yes stop_codon:yes gene_type:complete
MDPHIWGPGAWTLLHSVTFNYPEKPTQQDKNEFSDFFYALANVLPCSVCQDHFKKHLNNLPIKFYLESKETLTKWLFEIHNLVNQDTKKKTITYKQFKQIYKNIYSKSKESITYYKQKNKIQKIIIYLLIISIIVMLLVYKKYHTIFLF